MICATRALKPGPMRIGRIAGDMVLPRTVPIVSLLAGGGGALFGLLIGASFLGIQGALYFATLLGAAGVGLVTYSPLKGQSLLTWLGLNLSSRLGGRVERDGELYRVAVGICPLPAVPAERVRIRFGAANVAPSSYDERGAVRSVRNRNLGPLFDR
jgi:hypothetical protein